MHRYRQSYYYLKIISDLFWLTICFLAAVFIAKYRIHSYLEQYQQIKVTFFGLETRELILLFVLCLVWYLSSKATGLYDDFRTRTFTFEITAVFKNALIQALASMIVLFFLKVVLISRVFILTYFFLQLGFLGLWKLLIRILLSWARKKGRNLRSVLIIGAGRVGQDFYDAIISYPHLGYYVVGFLDDKNKAALGNLYLGTIDDLDSILCKTAIDEVVIALPNNAMERIDDVISVCENHPTHVRIIPDYFRFFSRRFNVSIFAGFPMVSIRTSQLDELHWRILKRSLDFLITIVLFIAVFSWLWPLIAVGVKLSSRGPVFFKQERWGEKNKKIVCHKFRSMRKDSRDVDEKGRYVQATRDDPRVTKFGRFLRRTSLDELPQFLNVLKGEMSIVGPRPHPTPLNLESKDGVRHYMLRHLVKPGITGWAQIKGYRGETRDRTLMQRRIDHDLWYIEHWTFWLDVQIILITLVQALKYNSNAY